MGLGGAALNEKSGWSGCCNWDYRAELVLAGSTCAVAGNTVKSDYLAYKHETKGYPSWRSDCSIPLRADGLSFTQEKVKGKTYHNIEGYGAQG